MAHTAQSIAAMFKPGVNNDLKADSGYTNYQRNLNVSVGADPLSQAIVKGRQQIQQQATQQKQQQNTFLSKVNKYYAQPVLDFTVRPFEKAAKDTVHQVEKQAKYFTGPSATEQQQQSIIKNQKYGTKIGVTRANSASGRIKAEQMAAQGKPQKQIKKYLNKDAAALGTQTGKGVNDVLLTAGSAPGEGFVAHKLSEALKLARGKDAGVKALIDSQRVANATKKVALADKLGAPAVKEAKTTHIPVKEPTTTRIPVGGKSTQVVGKVSKPVDYVKKSNLLSKQYEKEVASLEKLPSSRAQQVLQNRIDTKYAKFQQELDRQYGQTSISFKGKETGPRSAFTKELQNAPGRPVTGETKIPVNTVQTTEKTVTKATQAPKAPKVPVGEQQVAGSALREERTAVAKGLATHFENKATYATTSFKDEAKNAVDLLHSDPEKARSIAFGAKPGNNAVHEVAVRDAVKKLAEKQGDSETLRQLAVSSQHTTTSEAAQRLGSEGYFADPNDPVKVMQDLADTRASRRRNITNVKVNAVKKEIASQPVKAVSRQDWHSFIQGLQC